MAETFCGKSCLNCSVKKDMNCPGCMNGPGHPITGNCPIAECCREKGHSDCSTCSLKYDCSKYRSRGSQPEFRKEKMTADSEEKEYIAEYTPVMAKWFTLLFWCMLIANFTFIFTSNAFSRNFPGFYLACSIATGVFSILYGVILFRLSSIHEGYSIAGICAVVNAIYNIINGAVFKGDTPNWFILFSLIVYIAMIIEGYNFFNATSDVLMGVDNYLSEKWSELWKWYKWMMIGMIASLVLILIVPLIAMIVLLVSLVGIVIVDIIKFVYIFNTARTFNNKSLEISVKE